MKVSRRDVAAAPPAAPPRLRDLPREADFVGAGELVRAAAPLKDLTPVARQRMRTRLRLALEERGARPRRSGTWLLALRPAVIVLAALMGASAGGAAVYTMIGKPKRSAEVTTDTATEGESTSRARRFRRTSLAPKASGVAEAPENAPPVDEPTVPTLDRPGATSPNNVASMEPDRPAAAAVRDAPLPGAVNPKGPASHLGPRPPRGPSPPPRGAPAPAAPPPEGATPEASPPPYAPPSAGGTAARVPLSSTLEMATLADAIRKLRVQGDTDAALALLDEHQARFPSSALAPEVAAIRIEALLTAGRSAAALAELDRFPLDAAPGSNAWHVIRGELRAKVDRWQGAEADFTRALATAGRATDDLKERALWGRAAARAHLGNDVGARVDATSYLERFPEGRFAGAARRLLTSTSAVSPSAR